MKMIEYGKWTWTYNTRARQHTGIRQLVYDIQIEIVALVFRLSVGV